MQNEKQFIWVVAGIVSLFLAACMPAKAQSTETPAVSEMNTGAATAAVPATHPPLDPTYAAQIAELRSPDVPDLPFPDNPDPSQCGIPIQWGDSNQAWLTGIYGGELIQPTVLLYDSHLRFNVTAEAPHGSEVKVILYQQNPVTDYYLVKITGAESPNEGWIPAPFLSFNPPEKN